MSYKPPEKKIIPTEDVNISELNALMCNLPLNVYVMVVDMLHLPLRAVDIWQLFWFLINGHIKRLSGLSGLGFTARCAAVVREFKPLFISRALMNQGIECMSLIPRGYDGKKHVFCLGGDPKWSNKDNKDKKRRAKTRVELLECNGRSWRFQVENWQIRVTGDEMAITGPVEITPAWFIKKVTRCFAPGHTNQAAGHRDSRLEKNPRQLTRFGHGPGRG